MTMPDEELVDRAAKAIIQAILELGQILPYETAVRLVRVVISVVESKE
jgi:hypothetical protein